MFPKFLIIDIIVCLGSLMKNVNTSNTKLEREISMGLVMQKYLVQYGASWNSRSNNNMLIS